LWAQVATVDGNLAACPANYCQQVWHAAGLILELKSAAQSLDFALIIRTVWRKDNQVAAAAAQPRP
jgi:hypothetical protein